MPFLIIILVIAIAVVSTCVKIVPQAHSYVIERLGVYKETWSAVSYTHLTLPTKRT